MDNKEKKHNNKVLIIGLIATPIGFLLKPSQNLDISSIGNILALVGVIFLIYGLYKYFKAQKTNKRQ